MNYLNLFFILGLISLSAYAAEELPRTWTSTSGQTLAATFWKVENGVVELKKADGDLTTIKAESLTPEDIRYLVRKGGQVWGPTTKRLSGNYVIDPKGVIVPRRPSDLRISGKVTSVLDATTLIVTTGQKAIVVTCATAGITVGTPFSTWGRVSDETMVMPDGTSGKVYVGFTPLEDGDETGRLIQKDPLRFSRFLTGKSAACTSLENAQSTLKKVAAQEERKTEQVKARVSKRAAAEKSRGDERQAAKDAKLKKTLEEDISNYERQVKKLESNIRTWEAKKRRLKMHSKGYNSMRKRIGEAEVKIRKLEKSIRDANAELLKR